MYERFGLVSVRVFEVCWLLVFCGCVCVIMVVSVCLIIFFVMFMYYFLQSFVFIFLFVQQFMIEEFCCYEMFFEIVDVVEVFDVFFKFVGEMCQIDEVQCQVFEGVCWIEYDEYWCSI